VELHRYRFLKELDALQAWNRRNANDDGGWERILDLHVERGYLVHFGRHHRPRFSSTCLLSRARMESRGIQAATIDRKRDSPRLPRKHFRQIRFEQCVGLQQYEHQLDSSSGFDLACSKSGIVGTSELDHCCDTETVADEQSSLLPAHTKRSFSAILPNALREITVSHLLSDKSNEACSTPRLSTDNGLHAKRIQCAKRIKAEP
jgi:hypothetical protein